MSRNYLQDKTVKKKSAERVLWLLLVILLLAISITIKIVRSSSALSPPTNLPDGADAYSVAKEVITQRSKHATIEFSNDKYQLVQPSDSIYIIKSETISKKNDGQEINTQYKVTLKYNGGQSSLQKNWTVLNVSTN